MYVRINRELGLPFSENVIKSIATGVVTNIGATAVGLIAAGAIMKLVPGLGSIGGAAVMAATMYGVTIVAGIVYMNAISRVLKNKKVEDISEADLKAATGEEMNDKEALKDILKAARSGYKNSKA